jgi:hypothetical protein
LRCRIDGGKWQIALFLNEEPPGNGGNGTTPNANLLAYLGGTPLYFKFTNELLENSEIQVELSYVELLPYSFDEVTFKYPSDYSLIQSEIIFNSQSLNFNLNSDRTIANVELFNNTGTMRNDGNTATVNINQNETISLNNILIKYQLASDELGVIPFSTFLEEGVNECDDFGDGFFGLVVEP